MENVLGIWRANVDVSVRMGVSVFTLTSGSRIRVKQIDGDKLLVDVGSRHVDWKHKSFLVNFDRVV